MPATTFAVADVPVAATPSKRIAEQASVESLLRRRIEAMDLADPRLVTCKDVHPFAQAAHDAFFLHYPLTISPDDIWFCLAQGFANHVSLNAEALRHRFVQHTGKEKLVVVRNDFVLGQPNPWPEVFSAFSEQIAGFVGQPLRDMIVADFSTTTAFHRAATEVAMMDTFQPYFEYEMLAGCGIPQITLTGAPDDWRDIRRRAAMFASYGLEEWVAALLPVLDQIEASSRGHHDREFWNSFFRYKSGSGGSAMTGWIHVLFPYLKTYEGKLIPNEFFKTWSSEYRAALASRGKGPWPGHEEFDGPSLGQMPPGVSSAPVRVIDGRSGEAHEMRFVAGMFGVAQDPFTKTLSPSFGWAVVYDAPLPVEKRERRF